MGSMGNIAKQCAFEAASIKNKEIWHHETPEMRCQLAHLAQLTHKSAQQDADCGAQRSRGMGFDISRTPLHKPFPVAHCTWPTASAGTAHG